MKPKMLLLFSVLMSCTVLTAMGQISEGNYLLGGNAAFNTSKNQSNTLGKSEGFNATVQFGKAIKENSVAGLIFSYGHSKNTYNSANTWEYHSLSAGIFYRKYKSLAKDFYFFGETDLVYSHSNNTQLNPQSPNNKFINTNNGGQLSFVPGISYAICKRLQMELSLPYLVNISYGNTKTENRTGDPSTSYTVKGSAFAINANLNTNLLSNFGIGFKLILGK